jgi:hypothetical protein
LIDDLINIENLYEPDPAISKSTKLGEADANIEWNSSTKPLDTFLNTISFEEFKQEDALFLYGRRGTGKTAIIRMLHYEIRNHKDTPYSYVWRLNSDYAHTAIIDIVFNHKKDKNNEFERLPLDSLVNKFKKYWIWLIKTSAMAGVLWENLDSKNKYIRTIKKYLQDQKLIGEDLLDFENNLFREFINIIQEEGNLNNIYIQTGVFITNVIKRLFTVQFEEAEKALNNFLCDDYTPKKCLVLADSIEYYDLENYFSKAVRIALIEATNDIYANKETCPVIAKIALPSEIQPYLGCLNLEKIEQKSVYIHWRFKDLVGFVAKRLNSYYNSAIDPQKLEDFHEACKFLYSYLPPHIKTRQGICIDTMAYIIRHTQKKPRQLLIIMNTIMAIAELSGTTPDKPKRLPQLLIIKGVHAHLDSLFNGAVNDAFQSLYPKCIEIVETVLFGADCIFSHSTLDKMIKQAGSLRKEGNIDALDIKRLLIESGVIGKKGDKTSIFRDKNIACYEGFFEYQKKGLLPSNSLSDYVIHPMFYQVLHIKTDFNVFIYPKPYENEEQSVLSSA